MRAVAIGLLLAVVTVDGARASEAADPDAVPCNALCRRWMGWDAEAPKPVDVAMPPQRPAGSPLAIGPLNPIVVDAPRQGSASAARAVAVPPRRPSRPTTMHLAARPLPRATPGPARPTPPIAVGHDEREPDAGALAQRPAMAVPPGLTVVATLAPPQVLPSTVPAATQAVLPDSHGASPANAAEDRQAALPVAAAETPIAVPPVAAPPRPLPLPMADAPTRPSHAGGHARSTGFPPALDVIGALMLDAPTPPPTVGDDATTR